MAEQAGHAEQSGHPNPSQAGPSGPSRPSTPMEADSDIDSAIEVGSDSSSSRSLSSSIQRFHEENGRTYHALNAGKYILPNDELENDRLDCQNHHFLVTFDGKRYFCPGADTAQRVLDIGTGTGIWAIEHAEEHPHAEVIGVDLSPIQPLFVPPNCKFEIDDIELDWTWSIPFDYIFSRMMVGSIADYDNFIKKAYGHLQPGGYLEMIDCIFPLTSDDGTLSSNTVLKEWSDFLLLASQNLGRSLSAATHHESLMKCAGFEDVVVKHFKWPTNTWPKERKNKEVGLWTLTNIGNGLEGLSMALLTRGLGWSKEEVLVYLPKVRNELKNRTIHAYWPILVIYGRKPKSAAASTTAAV